MTSTAAKLLEIYARLEAHFGPQNWWPAPTTFEVLVGAVLTQNTSWLNVEKALARLREAGLLSFEGLSSLPEAELAEYIRASGYYNLKARRLKNLLQMIDTAYGGKLEALLGEPTEVARQALLMVSGIGPETADSILLYAGNHPVFVVDTYTYRVLQRHQLIPEECDYQTIQDLFLDHLEHDAALFNQYHALLVMTAKTFCKKAVALCEQCPLKDV
jgi:endonuclease-3 related protein